MSNKGLVSIEPIEGFFIHGVPHQHQAVSKAVADQLVATGAFEFGGKVTNEATEVGAMSMQALEAAEEAPAEPEDEAAPAEDAEAPAKEEEE